MPRGAARSRAINNPAAPGWVRTRRHVAMYRSPASVSRTARVVRLTEAGERYIATCRRVLTHPGAAGLFIARERAAPRGMLTVTAPLLFGHLYVRPLVDRAAQLRFDLAAGSLRTQHEARN